MNIIIFLIHQFRYLSEVWLEDFVLGNLHIYEQRAPLETGGGKKGTIIILILPKIIGL